MRVHLATMGVVWLLAGGCTRSGVTLIGMSGTTGSNTGASTAGSSGTSTGGTPTDGGLASGTSCMGNIECQSGVCGLAGMGNCCKTACVASCNPAGCDSHGDCLYPPGQGCCASGADCPASDPACDVGNASCCPALPSTIYVDAVAGSNSAACCGIGPRQACQTIDKAMQLIDSAQAAGITVNATIDGGGGDWDPPGEAYPIRLGYVTTLHAEGVYFLEPATSPSGLANPAIFEIDHYSANDVNGGASLQGLGFPSPGSYLYVGMSSDGTRQTAATSAIAVEQGNGLGLQGVTVNGSILNTTNEQAILLRSGDPHFPAALVVADVIVGNFLGESATNGSRGIVSHGPVSIFDRLVPGTSALTIVGQELSDLSVEGNSGVTLRNGFVVGGQLYAGGSPFPGFGACATKLDATSSLGATAAVLISGNSGVDIRYFTARCIGSAAIRLQASAAGSPASSQGSPTLNLDQADIENTDVGIYASAGTATVTNSLIRYNHIGVEQATDGTNNGSVDLSGGGNTIVCSNSSESSQAGGVVPPGIDVFNASSAVLNANNVTWGTTGPDYFTCDPAFTSCACDMTSCSTLAGSNDMDAVTLDAGITRLDGLRVSDGGCG
jgi:hypothetical protein